jgi:ferredoxin
LHISAIESSDDLSQGEKMRDSFQKLARHLDMLPGGFPSTESGVELRILERLFTRQEAEVASVLHLAMEPPEGIAARIKMPEAELAPLLERMAKKGLILHSRKGAQDYYMAAQFVIGIWEYHVNDLDPALIRDFNAYVPDLMKAQLSRETHQLRVIPVSKSIPAEMRVLHYEDAEEIVKRQSRILVAPCICRKEHRMAGKGCTAPLDSCLVFGGGAYFYEENGIGRTVSKEEALDILAIARDAGLVLQPGNAQRPLNICMCCDCCCQVLKNLKSLPNPGRIVTSSFRAAVDPDRCTGCGKCAVSCRMNAVFSGEPAVVDPERCIGCGLCAVACPEGAMRLIEKQATEKREPPKTIFDTYRQIMGERGK